ncbi:MAG TPA: S8/S53 family peptidase [Chloroflexota bacterium]|nr:S8/S53 family peptidase [Chloroflexota bacterium]
MATSREPGRPDSPREMIRSGLRTAATLVGRQRRNGAVQAAEGPLYMPGEVLLTFTAPTPLPFDDKRLTTLIARASRIAGVTLQPVSSGGSVQAREAQSAGRGQALTGAARPPLTVRTRIHTAGITAFRKDPVKRTVGRINERLGTLREADVSLVSAMPNWILNSGSAGSARAHGGPGTIPDPAPHATWTITAPSGNARPVSGTDTAGTASQGEKGQVSVAILDTSPGPQALLSAAARFPNNWLLQRLTANGTDANAVITEWNTFTPPTDVPSWPTNSEVDHGLFICGIINNLAPSADLHLLHVLDDEGRGRTDLLLEALQHCLDLARQGRRVVVNLSLYLLIPPGHEFWQRWFGPYKHLLGARPAAMARALDLLDVAVETTIALLLDAGAVVVAAAGNDALIYGYPPQPRLPADYPGVLCVVATDREGRRAAYSNEGEIPVTGHCVAAYGGQGELVDRMVGAKREGTIAVVPPGADPRDGMVGVFCSSDFKTADGPQANTSGWAYWSGTSFAAPLVSALAANILAQNELDRQNDPGIPRLTPHAVIDRIVDLGTPPSDPTLLGPRLRFVQMNT